MRHVQITAAVVLGLQAVQGALGALERRAQCAVTISNANAVANRLQSYYNSNTGAYNGGGRWTDANNLEDLHNLMLGAGTTTWDSVGNTWDVVQTAKANPNQDWFSYNQGFNDDAQWIILALWKIADYKRAHGQDTTLYMNTAATIYNNVASQWDNTCGGGVWWTTDHTYKNAITNELFLYTSARGFQLTGQASYKTNAQKTWAWLEHSGMRNAQGLWNDGLDLSTCKNNGQNTWTYNQGVIAAGLGALYAITGNTTLLDQAEITLDAEFKTNTVNSVLKEICDATTSSCNGDSEQFKGIFMKHLQYYLDTANSASRTAKYSALIGKQTTAVLAARNSAGDVGSSWYLGSNQSGAKFAVQATDAGLEALVNGAKYGPC